MTEKRIYGIDLLRIFSMIGVIMLHVMGHGGVLETTSSNVAFSLAWLIEIIAYPAVNCYVLISGFVGYRESRYYPRIKNIVSLFCTVLFYSVLICLLFKVANPEIIGKKDILKSFFPVLTKQYWFFTTYIMMALVTPMLNMFVHKADSMMLGVSVTLIVSCTILSKLSLIDLGGGYSFIWFTMLYMLGAIIKKEDYIHKCSFLQAFMLVIVSVLITWVTKIVLHFNNVSYGLIHENMFVSYCSLTMLAFAVGLLLVFAKINIRGFAIKIIAFLTPMVFSVYLIHDNKYVREFMVKDNLVFINDFSVVYMPIMVFGCAIGIFIVCSLIDRVRIILFQVMHIGNVSENIGNYIKLKAVKLFPKNR